MILGTLLAFLIPAILSLVLSPLFISMAHRYNFLDYPSEERKQHKKPTPHIGGIVLFVSFWTTIAVGFLAVTFIKPIYQFLDLPPFFYNPADWSRKIFGVFSGSLLITTVGWFDDRLRLNPIPKLLAQGLAAFLLLQLGLQVNLVQELGVLGYAVTFAWIILVMNAFNFIDSIDGHCLGVAFISCIMFFLMTQIVQQPAIGLLILILAGALGGFLPFNFKPAKSFLGDSGSLFIGYMMSVITLLCRYNTGADFEITPLVPILLFGVPIYDTLSVMTVRLARGIPPWRGDRNHLAHRLVKLGMGEKNAALFSYFIAISLGLLALLTTQIQTALGNLLIVMIFSSVIIIIAFLEYYAAVRIRMVEQLASIKKRRKEDILEAEDRP